VRTLDALRAQFGQVKLAVAEFRQVRRLAVLWGITRTTRLPQLPRHTGPRREIWAVAMVRDEVDVIEHAIRHTLAQGIDHILIADNGSTDGTIDLLQSLALEDSRIHVARDTEPGYYQAEKMTYLSHVAWRAGAAWVLPFDADEFFFARGRSIADFLRSTSASTVYAAFHHMTPTEAGGLTSTTEFLLDSTPDAVGKVAVRAHPLLVLVKGNHDARRVGTAGHGLFLAHAIYRSPEQIARKVRQGRAAEELVRIANPLRGDHWTAGAALDDAQVAQVWDNLVHGRSDDRLRFRRVGPLVSVTPLSWQTWDPDGSVDRARDNVIEGSP
jgi:hypothetical protein